MANQFYFARLQDDGRLTSPLPQSFPTIEGAKLAAPELFVGLRPRRDSKLVLVMVIEEVSVVCNVGFTKFGQKPEVVRTYEGKPLAADKDSKFLDKLAKSGIRKIEGEY